MRFREQDMDPDRRRFIGFVLGGFLLVAMVVVVVWTLVDPGPSPTTQPTPTSTRTATATATASSEPEDGTVSSAQAEPEGNGSSTVLASEHQYGSLQEACTAEAELFDSSKMPEMFHPVAQTTPWGAGYYTLAGVGPFFATEEGIPYGYCPSSAGALLAVMNFTELVYETPMPLKVDVFEQTAFMESTEMRSIAEYMRMEPENTVTGELTVNWVWEQGDDSVDTDQWRAWVVRIATTQAGGDTVEWQVRARWITDQGWYAEPLNGIYPAYMPQADPNMPYRQIN